MPNIFQYDQSHTVLEPDEPYYSIFTHRPAAGERSGALSVSEANAGLDTVRQNPAATIASKRSQNATQRRCAARSKSSGCGVARAQAARGFWPMISVETPRPRIAGVRSSVGSSRR